jgi:glucose-6-phosphate isomerase
MAKRKILTLDYSLMLRDACGVGGVPQGEISAMWQQVEEARALVVARWSAKKEGFLSVPDRTADLRAVETLAAAVRRQFRTLIVVGIGGSDLGARALLKALPSAKGMTVKFLGANTDPEELAAALKGLDWSKTAINVISKSGDTIEPMTTFLILRERLIKAVGEKAHARHVIATTDAVKGTLRTIADREGYRTLPVPADVGGRFSVLTPVGLFPAACAGLDVAGLLAGTKAWRNDCLKAPAAASPTLQWAAFQHDAYFRGHRITVLMPYSESLRELAFWFRQLWAESLGKRHDRAGTLVRLGFTPVAALGATDQHSQVQLYNEGPTDKTVTFIEVAEPRADFIVPKSYPDLEGVAYLGGHRLSAVNHAERAATAQALAASGCPNGTFTVPSITSESLGALLMHFMFATAVVAELLDVNAYDQPGVEEGKRLICAGLGRPGYTA